MPVRDTQQSVVSPTILVVSTPPQPAAETPPPQPVVEKPPQQDLEGYFQLDDDPTKHATWPARWRKLLDYAKTFVLSKLLYSHGFPSLLDLHAQAGEGLTLGWQIYHQKFVHVQLNGQVCAS